MQRVSGFAEQGANVVWTMGHMSSNVVQESFPFAKIAVYLTGTTTLAMVFLDTNTPPTPLSNPFTADENGWWWFYAPNGRYDIQIWPRTPVDLPWTIGDVLVSDPATAGLNLTAGPGIVVTPDAGLLATTTVALDSSSILLDNGVCPPITIQFDQNCNLVFTNSSGVNILTLSQGGDMTIPGTLTAAAVNGGATGSQWVNGPNGVIYYNGGNVGIGTATPQTTLDVKGHIRSTGSDTPTGGSGIEMGFLPAGRGFLSAVNRDVPMGSPGNPDAFYPLQLEGNDIVLYSFGKGVGVKMVSPQYALDVAGDVNITGLYRVNGIPIQTGGGGGAAGVSSINGYSGAVSLTQGSNIVISPSGNGVSISTPSDVTFNLVTANTVNASQYLVNGQPLAAMNPAAGWTVFPVAVNVVFDGSQVPLGWSTGLYRITPTGDPLSQALEWFIEFQSLAYLNIAYSGGVRINLPFPITPAASSVEQASCTMLMNPANIGGTPNFIPVTFYNASALQLQADMYINAAYLVSGSALLQ